MKNIHVLPTDKPSRLYSYKNKLFLTTESHLHSTSMKYQNIYITSDEEIKEGDWFIRDGSIHKCFRVHKTDIEFLTSIDSVYCGSNTFWSKEFCKKIILTDNKDLIKDGIQPIDDEFLEWFVAHPSCEEVEIEKIINPSISVKESYYSYKIIIPKEEPCEHFTPTIGCIKDVCSCNKEPKKAPFKHKVESLSTEEVLANRSDAYEFIDFDKQETVEEAAEKWYDSTEENKGFPKIKAFKEGAKWQMERSYNEEEVLELLQNFANDLSDNVINIKFWFEQFKITVK